jgi:hypothetical protein
MKKVIKNIKNIFKIISIIILEILSHFFDILGNIYALIVFWDWDLETLGHRQNMFHSISHKLSLLAIRISIGIKEKRVSIKAILAKIYVIFLDIVIDTLLMLDYIYNLIAFWNWKLNTLQFKKNNILNELAFRLLKVVDTIIDKHREKTEKEEIKQVIWNWIDWNCEYSVSVKMYSNRSSIFEFLDLPANYSLIMDASKFWYLALALILGLRKLEIDVNNNALLLKCEDGIIVVEKRREKL